MSELVTVRYPSGATEFRMSDKAPEVGDVLVRNGDSWIVEAVSEADQGARHVTLRPASPTGPSVLDSRVRDGL